MWLLLALRVVCGHVSRPYVCSSGAAGEDAAPAGMLRCCKQTCDVAWADVVISCPAVTGRDSARGHSGQVNIGAASKGHSAAGRAGQSHVKQERVSQPAPDSSDAGSMEELPSPAKQEADTKPEPEVRTQSLTLETPLESRDSYSVVASQVQKHSCRIERVMAACARLPAPVSWLQGDGAAVTEAPDAAATLVASCCVSSNVLSSCRASWCTQKCST